MAWKQRRNDELIISMSDAELAKGFDVYIVK